MSSMYVANDSKYNLSMAIARDGIEFEENRLQRLVNEFSGVVEDIKKKPEWKAIEENSALIELNERLRVSIQDALAGEMAARREVEEQLWRDATNMEGLLTEVEAAMAADPPS